MKLHPRVTKTAVELVKRFEGLRRKAARLPDGSWTIGYGHTLTAREGAEVSPEDAEALLYYDLSDVASKVEAWTFAPLNQNQFEALTAFAFNIGLENFRRSTVLKRVNEGQHLQAGAAMELWRKSEVDGEGMVIDALVRRRAAEKAHYLTPPEGFKPSPTQVLKPAFDFSVIEAAAQSHVAQRAAVVDAPMDGAEASATVETAPEPFHEPKPQAEQPAPVAEPVLAVELEAVAEPEPELALEPTHHTGESIGAVAAAAAVAAPVLYAVEHSHADHAADHQPEPEQAAEIAAVETPQPVNDGGALEAPPFPAAAPASPFGFRGFEPPPPRFARRAEAPPAPANQAVETHEVESEPATVEPVAPTALAEPEHDFSLFDRPLAPPEPPVQDTGLAFPDAPLRVVGEHATEVVEPVAAPATPTKTGGGFAHILQDRTVLYASIGLLGVALFALAIFTMLIGHATLAHLFFGFLGVVLIIPSGIYFMLRGMGHQPAPQTGEPVPDLPQV